jgi:hypothetical protein
MAVGSRIEDTDYNAIRAKIVNIMGPGSGQFGYGQSIVSSEVDRGFPITKDQWDALRFDILNARLHQDGLQPTIIEAVRGQPIRFSSQQPNTQYSSQSDVAIANKFNIGSGQFVINSAGTVTRTSSWNSSISSSITVTFGNANQARWFFNSGGRIRFTSSRSGGAATAQNTAWSSLLSSVGTVSFDATNFYQSTTSPSTLLIAQSSFPYYTANRYRITHSCNVANNINAGATVVNITVIWEDGYIDTKAGPPGDSVDGTLSLVVDELRASGILFPAGTPPFVVSRPSYNITSISGS